LQPIDIVSAFATLTPIARSLRYVYALVFVYAKLAVAHGCDVEPNLIIAGMVNVVMLF
jgi:hypothetical protein